MIKKVLFFILILANIGCDQISKDSVRKNIELYERISVVENTLTMTKVENSGAALGLGQNLPNYGKQLVLNYFPLILLLGMMGYILKKPQQNFMVIVGFSFVIGGGIGNLIDRFKFGSVTDFLHISYGFFKTGIFNMADVSVTLGAFLILIVSFQRPKILNN